MWVFFLGVKVKSSSLSSKSSSSSILFFSFAFLNLSLISALRCSHFNSSSGSSSSSRSTSGNSSSVDSRRQGVSCWSLTSFTSEFTSSCLIASLGLTSRSSKSDCLIASSIPRESHSCESQSEAPFLRDSSSKFSLVLLIMFFLLLSLLYVSSFLTD
ncbi:Uncharacterised protein [Salmonella enterica subsp. enterica serovar Typhi]|nr:Uncharacterised protein [Salmonella enterica subsp. enterica serovar Typhi]